MWRPLARTASQIRKECVDIRRGGVNFKRMGKQSRKLWGKKDDTQECERTAVRKVWWRSGVGETLRIGGKEAPGSFMAGELPARKGRRSSGAAQGAAGVTAAGHNPCSCGKQGDGAMVGRLRAALYSTLQRRRMDQ